MSSLSEIWVKKETLETILKTLNAKGEKGISLNVGINDDTNKHGQNVTVTVTQSKEDRDAKKDKYYVGNGKVFWTDGKITVATKVDKPSIEPEITNENSDNLPF